MKVTRKGKPQTLNGDPFDVHSQLMLKGGRAMIRVVATLLVLSTRQLALTTLLPPSHSGPRRKFRVSIPRPMPGRRV